MVKQVTCTHQYSGYNLQMNVKGRIGRIQFLKIILGGGGGEALQNIMEK